ncbi:MAG: 2-hydroxychromene-2-carboxylate isomerase [Candidatus Binatia bacterium]
MPGTLEIDVFWSFRSPWSYLATPRLTDWERRYDLRVRFRPVYPIAIRTPEFFERMHPLWPRYLLIDVVRVAEFLGLPFQWPRPDPVVQEVRDGRFTTAPEQPYIHRLTRLGVLAEERGGGIAFAAEVSRLIWGGTEAWHEGTHMAEAAGRAGLDLAELDRFAEADAERLAAVIEQNQADHEAAGHWGVPTCAFRGEPFFGQDRLDVLLWRLRQNGLRER